MSGRPHTGPIARSSTTWVKKSNFVDVQWNLYQFVQKWSYYIAVVFVFQHNCYFMAKTQLKHELRNRLDRTRPPHSSTTYLWSTKTITIWGGIPHLYTSNDSSRSAEHTQPHENGEFLLGYDVLAPQRFKDENIISHNWCHTQIDF